MTTTGASESLGQDGLEQNSAALSRICTSYREMIAHSGFGEMRVEVRILKRGQKEVIVHFGKQYRYVVDA